MVRDWGSRLAAACGPMLGAMLLAALCAGEVPELATFGVLTAFAAGLAWLAGTSRRYRDLWMVTGPGTAFIASVAGLVLTSTWTLAPAASAALWFGPAVSLLGCMTWAMSPGQAWPAWTPGRLAGAVPYRVAMACAGASLATLAVALGGLQGTPWPAALLAGVIGMVGATVCVLPLGEDSLVGRASEQKLARLRKLLDREDALTWLPDEGEPNVARLPAFSEAPSHPWADPDLEARAEGLGRDLLTAQDRIAEQNRVVAELKATIAEQTARLDRLSAGYRRVREAATANLSLLGQTRRDVEGALNDIGIISDSVGQIVGTSESTDLLIDESRQRLREALESMEYVRLSIEDSLDLVEAFAKRSRQIEDVLKDIADIAYFTRILSLNATIEAARAGEQGKGFRFLADEVQKLAQTITQSTSDITALLKLVQQESKQTVESVLRSANQVGEAADTVSLLDEALHRIMDELHSMDADLQDAHLMSLRVQETRDQAMSALGSLEEGNLRADFAARMVEEIAAEDAPPGTRSPTTRLELSPDFELPGGGAPAESAEEAAFAAPAASAVPQAPVATSSAPAVSQPTGPFGGSGATAPLPEMEWPEDLD